jgi:hypothetical protein
MLDTCSLRCRYTLISSCRLLVTVAGLYTLIARCLLLVTVAGLFMEIYNTAAHCNGNKQGW